MHEIIRQDLINVRFGILLSVITLAFSLIMGALLGSLEDNFREHLKAKAEQVLDTKYNGDVEQMERTANRSLGYFRRAHFHAAGLGIVSLGLIFVLMLLSADNRIKKITAICLGIGSLGYSQFWLFAGLKAPGMGGTQLAKESLNWLARPSAGLCILGVIAVLGLLISTLFFAGNKTIAPE